MSILARIFATGFTALVLAVSVTPGTAVSQSVQPSRWASLPTPEEIAASYPPEAYKQRLGGETLISCDHDRQGQLVHCKVLGDVPEGLGFGAAALTLTPKFRLRMDPSIHHSATIIIPMIYAPPGPPPPIRQAAFQTAPKQFQWLAPIGPYWPEVALRRNLGGRVQVDCHVAGDGKLNHCGLAYEDPPGFGFADATMRMIQRGYMQAGPAPPGVAAPTDGLWRFDVDFPAHSICDDPAFPASRVECRRLQRAGVGG